MVIQNENIETVEHILVTIEDTLWDSDRKGQKIDFSSKEIRAIIKIFMSAMMSKMWDFCEDNKIEMPIREEMADKLGRTLHDLILEVTGIDTLKLYDNE